MPSKPIRRKPAKRAVTATVDVGKFLASLEHPRKPEILELRRIILGAAPGVGEEIKWNAPSFHTSGHFATFHLRAKDGVAVILHLGATKRADTSGLESIADPASLLRWLGPDRAIVTFRDLEDIGAKRAAFRDVLRQWIAQV